MRRSREFTLLDQLAAVWFTLLRLAGRAQVVGSGWFAVESRI